MPLVTPADLAPPIMQLTRPASEREALPPSPDLANALLRAQVTPYFGRSLDFQESHLALTEPAANPSAPEPTAGPRSEPTVLADGSLAEPAAHPSSNPVASQIALEGSPIAPTAPPPATEVAPLIYDQRSPTPALLANPPSPTPSLGPVEPTAAPGDPTVKPTVQPTVQPTIQPAAQPAVGGGPAQAPNVPSTASPAGPSLPLDQLKNEGIVELKADRQTYDQLRQVFTADGRVSMRFRGSLLVADRVQVNLLNRYVVAEGNVTFVKGSQVLQGQRFDYNFVQGQGKIRGARGEIYLPEAANLTSPLPNDNSVSSALAVPVGQRIYANQPPQNVAATPGGVNVILGSARNTSGTPVANSAIGGNVRRLRFEADQADFYPEGWTADNVRITNDPFSPPELELRTPRAKLTKLSPLRDELRAEKPRLVFDQRFALPLLINRIVIDRRERQPGLFQIGFDSNDRGGLFIGRTINIISNGDVQFSITPQFLVQKALSTSKFLDPDSFGLTTKLIAPLGPRGVIKGTADIASLDFAKADTKVRGSLRAQQLIGTHTLSLEASYRDRLFNNSLGFQDVQSSLGLLFFSPVIPLGKTGITASYQLGYQYINANTDRLDLLSPTRTNERISLGRYQASVALNRGFLLWAGKPLPATATAGLRYTPVPVVPYVSLGVGVTGVASGYSNGDTQRSVSLNASLNGQFGHSSRPFLDYTAFNLGFSQILRDGLSPFLFDRNADTRLLFAGITQQIYGPFRLGFQTAYNLDTGNEISTDYILEYSRRTYSVVLRYNPIQKLGSIGLKISDFNWGGGSEVFGGSGVSNVRSGVQQLGDSF